MSASEMPPLRDVQVAVAVVKRGDEVLLVRQRSAHNPNAHWTLPAGKVEPREFIFEGLKREILEETGLIAHGPFRILYIAQCISIPRQIRWTTFAYEIGDFEGELSPNDPDGLVLEARFVGRTEAIRLIEEYQPIRVMRDPVVSYLRNELVPGSSWYYRINDQNEDLPVQYFNSPQRLGL